MKSWNWWRNKRNVQKMCARELCKLKRKEAVITQRDSRGVPHRSTNRALRRLTSEFRWDPVHSTQYERRQTKHSSKYTQPLPSSPHMLQTKTTQIQPTNPYFACFHICDRAACPSRWIRAALNTPFLCLTCGFAHVKSLHHGRKINDDVGLEPLGCM